MFDEWEFSGLFTPRMSAFGVMVNPGDIMSALLKAGFPFRGACG